MGCGGSTLASRRDMQINAFKKVLDELGLTKVRYYK